MSEDEIPSDIALAEQSDPKLRISANEMFEKLAQWHERVTCLRTAYAARAGKGHDDVGWGGETYTRECASDDVAVLALEWTFECK